MSSGESRLRQLAARFAHRPEPTADCQQPDAAPDLPISHGLRLVSIESRLTTIERSVSNQNRLLLIGILALIGELAKSVLKP